MNEEDLKAILASYQQKAFELFNSNIVLETQVKTLQGKIEVLNNELEKLKKKRPSKTDDFE